jgi:hypothetical protein
MYVISAFTDVLANNDIAISVDGKRRRSGVIWMTENGEEFRRLVQFSPPEQILAGYAYPLQLAQGQSSTAMAEK